MAEDTLSGQPARGPGGDGDPLHRHGGPRGRQRGGARSSASASGRTASSWRSTPSSSRSPRRPPASSWPGPARARRTSPTRWPRPRARPARRLALSARGEVEVAADDLAHRSRHLHRLPGVHRALPLLGHRVRSSARRQRGRTRRCARAAEAVRRTAPAAPPGSDTSPTSRSSPRSTGLLADEGETRR